MTDTPTDQAADERADALTRATSDSWEQRQAAAAELVRYDDDECLTALGRLLCDWRNTAPSVAAANAIGDAKRSTQIPVLCAAIAVANDPNSELVTPALNRVRYFSDSPLSLEELEEMVSGWAWARCGLSDYVDWECSDSTKRPDRSPVTRAAEVAFDIFADGRVDVVSVLVGDGHPSDLAAQAIGCLLVKDDAKDHLAAVRAAAKALVRQPTASLTPLLLGGFAVAPPEHASIILDVLRRAAEDGTFELAAHLADATDPWSGHAASILPGLLAP